MERNSAQPSGWVATSILSEAAFALLHLLWARRRSRALPSDPRSIAILRTGFIGDVVLTTGMIRRIRDRHPAARLHYFCYPAARPILEGHAGLDRVWSPDWFPVRSLRDLLHFNVFRKMRHFAREARREKIDLLLVPCRQQTLMGALKVGAVVRMIRPRVSVGLSYRNRGRFLDVKVPDEGLLVKHEADWCADVLRAAGIPGDCRTPSVEVGAEPSAAWARLLSSRGMRPEDRLVIIHPGGGSDASEPKWALKRWPAKNFARVARELGRMKGIRVAISGIESECPILREMMRHGMKGALNLVGETTLDDFAALARKAALVIGNDSGATHLAAAMGTPTIALFGYTDFIGYRPLGPQVSVLRHPMPCSPCLYWFDHPRCDKAYRCLRGISPREVLAEATRLLSVTVSIRSAADGISSVREAAAELAGRAFHVSSVAGR
jgi:ADP-heptose:LPS heptosyltransferase